MKLWYIVYNMIENHDDIEDIQEKRIKKSKTTTKIVTGIVIAIGATGLVVSGGIKLFQNKSTALVTTFEVTSTETTISYEVEATVNANKKLYIRVHNYFTDRKEELESDTPVSGVFEDLQKHMTYKVTLYEDKIAIQTIKIATYND